MISLFNELNRIEGRIEISSASMAAEELNELDAKYLDTWDQILAYQPETDQMTELMLLMLLDKMELLAARKESCIKVREKILALFQSKDDRIQMSGKQMAFLKPVRGIA